MDEMTVVEGRTKCSVCETDKSWALAVDHGVSGNLEKEIIAAIKRQNSEVVDPGHSGHLDKLEKTTRILRGYNV